MSVWEREIERDEVNECVWESEEEEWAIMYSSVTFDRSEKISRLRIPESEPNRRIFGPRRFRNCIGNFFGSSLVPKNRDYVDSRSRSRSRSLCREARWPSSLWRWIQKKKKQGNIWAACRRPWWKNPDLLVLHGLELNSQHCIIFFT